MDDLLRQMVAMVVPYMLVLASHEKLAKIVLDELMLAFDHISNSSDKSATLKTRAALCLYKEIEKIGG